MVSLLTKLSPQPRSELARQGVLLAGEGLDGSGKTTVMKFVLRQLEQCGWEGLITNWNDVKDIYNLTQRLTKAGYLDGNARILMGAAELAARYAYEVRPALAQGKVVVANKYMVSAIAHALARGCSREWVELVYEFAPQPDVTVYFDVAPAIALERKRKEGRLGFWETGIEIFLDIPVEEAMARFSRLEIADSVLADSFLDFQSKLREIESNELKDKSNVIWVDAEPDLDDVCRDCAAAVEEALSKEPQLPSAR